MKLSNALVLSTMFILAMHSGHAQISLYGEMTADSSAILEVSSTSKGILIPRMTSQQRNNISDPAEGLFIYNTTGNRFNYYNGSSWQTFDRNIYDIDGTLAGNREIIADSTTLKLLANLPNALSIKRLDSNPIGISFQNSGALYPVSIVSPPPTSGNANGLNINTVGLSGNPDIIGTSLQLTDNGTMILPEYGLGNKTGTLSKVLAITNDGTIIEADPNDINNKVDIIQDADMDTRVMVEKTADEDLIRFELGGIEQMLLEENPAGHARLDLSPDGSNTFVGTEAGQNTSAGIANVYIGDYAGREDTSGSHNVYIGDETGRNYKGSNNVFIGRRAGYGTGSGSGNVFIGRNTGSEHNGSNKLFIDNSTTVNPLIYGEFDNNYLRVNGKLNVNNQYSFPTIDGTNGQFLVTDGSGSLTWTDSLDVASISFAVMNLAWAYNLLADSLVAAKLTLPLISPGEGKVLTSDDSGNASWQDNNTRVAHIENKSIQTFAGNLSGWRSTNFVTNSMQVDAGDLVVVNATFSAKIEGGSGTDGLKFYLGMGNGMSTTSGGETALLRSFENHRGKFTQVSIQHTFVNTTDDDYVFRLYVNMSGTDDDTIIRNVNISAVRY